MKEGFLCDDVSSCCHCDPNFIFIRVLRFFRIEVVILALHYGSDVFLEAAKVFKYSRLEIGASVCFCLSWLLLRLTFFPFWVIRLSRYEYENDTIIEVFSTDKTSPLQYHLYSNEKLGGDAPSKGTENQLLER